MNRAKGCRVLLKAAAVLATCSVAMPLIADEGDPPSRAARLSYISGNVSFQPSGEQDWSQASLNYTVTTGDRLYTDQGSRAEVEVGPSAVRMSEGTDLTIANLDDRTLQLGLGQGSIRVSVYEMLGGHAIEIDTPNGALSVLGPGSYRVDVDPNGGTQVSVNSGSLEISGGGAEQKLRAGQAVELTGTGPIQINPVELPSEDGFDQWCASRDRRVRSFASRRYVSAYLPGAEDLDSYGRWETVGEYGPVWYPVGVPAGWVPYRYGRWVWVEPWGWTWVEDEPWGFCPFHYGRWAFIGTAWGWVPGPVVVAPVYAPALVAFVGGPGFSLSFHVGGLGVAAWFPLGPREPFLPWYHYGGNYLREVNVTNVRNVTNITNITNITNVNNINYVNRNVATTAVSAETFRGGQPVAQHVVRVAPEQIAKAQVIPHPQVTPVTTADFGGRKPVPTPPVRANRVTGPPTGVRGGQPASRMGAPYSRGGPSTPAPATASAPPTRTESSQPARTPPPVFSRSTPAERTPASANRPSPATENPRRSPGPFMRNPSPPPAAPPRVISRTPPPPRDVPFAAHQPAYSQHPGRPLEPQQEQNVRAGRPAGPMLDREVPAHAGPPPRSAPPPSRPSRSDNSKPGPAPKRDQRH